MQVTAVMEQLGRSLGSVKGLRVFDYPVQSVAPPAAVVGWPAPIRYDEAMARGADTITFPVLVVVGKADVRSARDALGVYLDGSGASSVKAALEGGLYSACDSVIVTEARVDPVVIAGVEYLAAILDVAVTGKGQ